MRMIRQVNRLCLGMLTVILLFFASCTKEKNPDYVGNWLMYGTQSNGDSVLQTKVVLTLNADNFAYLMKVKNNSTGVWIDYIGQKGNLKVTGDSFTVHFTFLGISALNENYFPTGVIVYLAEGDPGFTTLLNLMGGHNDLKGTYSISGNELTQKIDSTADRDTTDPGETMILTRS